MGEPFAIEILKVSSFSVCIPTFAACSCKRKIIKKNKK
jgi:hypothetical protein